MEMEQTVADALPDEKPAAPGMPVAPVSPKEFVEKAKEKKPMDLEAIIKMYEENSKKNR